MNGGDEITLGTLDIVIDGYMDDRPDGVSLLG